MKKFFNFLAITLVSVFAMGMVACNNGVPAVLNVTPASISFDADGVATGSAVVTATGSAWSAVSSNSWITVSPTAGGDGGSFIVSVSANTEAGAADRSGTIIVTSMAGAEPKIVNVTQLAPDVISVTDVVLDENNAHLVVNPIDSETNTLTLTATVMPLDAGNQDVTWSSSSDAIATVIDGVVTAVAPGNATITVTTADGGLTADCEITVTACGFLISDTLFNAAWAAAQTSCPEGWRVPSAEELSRMCTVYSHAGENEAVWPTDMNYWSSAQISTPRGRNGGYCSFDSRYSNCEVTAAPSNTSALYVRCIKDVE